MAKLSAKEVTKIFMDCMYKEDEVPDGKPPEDAIIVYGVVTNVGFNPVRIKAHEQEIIEMLQELPPTFFKSTGGGWSFLNMCVDNNYELWTGEHAVVEQLFLLGAAIGKASFCMERDFWHVLPGGIPYITIDL
jgi:hypothetical protein